MSELGDTEWEVAAAVQLNQSLADLASEFAKLAEKYRDYDDPATMSTMVHTPVGFGHPVMVFYVLKEIEQGGATGGEP